MIQNHDDDDDDDISLNGGNPSATSNKRV